MPKRPKRWQPGQENYTSGGKGGLLKALIAPGAGKLVGGGMTATNEAIPYEAKHPFLDRAFNEGRAGQLATEYNMARESQRYQDALARARWLDELKQKEVEKLAGDKELGQAALGQLNATDPIQRGSMARLAPLLSTEATSRQTIDRADKERMASEANPNVIGNRWLSEQMATEQEARSKMEAALQMVKFLQENPGYTGQDLDANLEGRQVTNRLTGANADRTEALNREVLPSEMESSVASNRYNTALKTAQTLKPNLDATIANENALRPGLFYQGKPQGQFYTPDAGGPSYEQRTNPITGMPETVRIEKPAKFTTLDFASPDDINKALSSGTTPPPSPALGGSPAITDPPPLLGQQPRKPLLKGNSMVAEDSILMDLLRKLKGQPRGLSQGIKPYGY